MNFQSSTNRLANTTWNILNFLFLLFLAYFLVNYSKLEIFLKITWDSSIKNTALSKLIDILSNRAGYFVKSLDFGNPKVKRKVNSIF
jgi:hypothetical protein